MYVCYVDESGSADTLCEAIPASTPVLVLAGLIVPQNRLKDLTWAYLQLKKDHVPHLRTVPRLSTVIAYEVKGADLRSDIRSGVRRRYRRATHLITSVIGLLEQYDCRVLARVFVKDVDVVNDDRAVYGYAISWICRTFHASLEASRSTGLVVLDSRTKVKNTPNADVITTQKFRRGGDSMPLLLEVPVFGHSDSHIALQIVDLLVSAVLFPSACAAYCQALTWNQHAHPSYEGIRTQFATRVKDLQYRYFDPVGGWRGGIYASGTSGGLPPIFNLPPGIGNVPLPGI